MYNSAMYCYNLNKIFQNDCKEILFCSGFFKTSNQSLEEIEEKLLNEWAMKCNMSKELIASFIHSEAFPTEQQAIIIANAINHSFDVMNIDLNSLIENN